MQVEGNANLHPPKRYYLPTPWHPANNLPILPTDHCGQQRHHFVGSSFPAHCCCLCFRGQLLGTTIQEPCLQNPNPPFKVTVHPFTGTIFHLHQFSHCPLPYQRPIPLSA